MKAHLRAIFCSYSEIFFLQSPVVGVLLFAVTLHNPNVALAGLISVLAAYGLARMVRMDQHYLASGYYTYNPLLVGLSLGYLFKLTPLTIFFIISTGAFTMVVTLVMANIFMSYLRLPILSAPFVIVSSLAYLASLHYSNLLAAAPQRLDLPLTDANLPIWITGFCKSMGTVLFSPSVLVGAIFAILVLLTSRILFALALLGYFTGAGVRMLMLGSAEQAFGDVANFNFILIAMAMGSVFLIPSLSSYLLALLAVVMSSVLLDGMSVFWSQYGIPAFTLPFNVVCLHMIYMLTLLNHPMVARRVGRTPEETLEDYQTNRLRYPGNPRTLYLPISGKWTVWQAFDGQWTHKGSWRYAYDFVITDEQGRTHCGEGLRLEDYYCYRKPVLSPIRGRVVKVIDDIPDNPPGSTDTEHNWGNLVILQDSRGFFVEISHLASNSIRVKVGDWLERGMPIGLCGNSGQSPQPHIHIQAQLGDDVGAGSVPFSFASYAADGVYHSNDLPREGQQVESIYPDKHLDGITNFMLDEVQEFQVQRDGREVGRLRVKVKMAMDGTFFFQSDRGALYFGKHEGTFYLYRVEGRDEWLREIFLALPRLPLSHREKLAWTDYVPVGLVASRPRRMVARLLSSFYPSLATVQARLTFSGPSRISTVIESRRLGVCRTAEVELDARKGFASVRVGGLVMRRLGCDPA